MKIERLNEYTLVAHDYIDYLTLRDAPSQFGMQLVVKRVYADATTRLDFKEREPGWLLFRRAQQGMQL